MFVQEKPEIAVGGKSQLSSDLISSMLEKWANVYEEQQISKLISLSVQ